MEQRLRHAVADGQKVVLTMMILDDFDKGGDNRGDRNVVLLVLQSNHADTITKFI